MQKKRYELIEIIMDEQAGDQFQSQGFIQLYQTALFLSLLEKKLLTQRQFDRCIEELEKQDIKALRLQ